ncbi:probable cyclin-dependent serine/threonine-protein kinase DDB_G0292550 isoform X2 [Metopolophium dirhodum]|uniref:probable cyclin-dependent serine/threonine-protein kinase DDB_G0292550 isoform X2 n=1 Tax=Metopolophium dirhodum TaxID=44670 RepID=UPI0029902B41|nr:probable cyclin-dependent serine/threonine-protein kinase DDB_G0292550 isoform X2 [Metopolophium dirhodum]
MYPSPWTTSVPPPAATKPIVNSYENNMQSYPFYGANTMQNIPMNQSLQPNAIDPAMVQKWQEWKRWEVWQQQFQQWQQQTGQITSATTQPAPPPMPPSQSLQPSQPPPISFQNLQYSYHPPGPPLPVTNQSQQNTINNEVGMKRGLEPEFQSEKKIKIDMGNNKKEIELSDETEVLFEEQFKSWEEQFLKWKEQNKNHPDKVQYLEYEKKWINWRDHLKQKCEVLKKKRELKLVEKKKEAIQVEENKLQTQQRLSYNPMMPNNSNLINEPPLGPPPPSLQQSHNNPMTHSNSENQIPGLDLDSNNENSTKGFLKVSRILPQNQIRPIQTPDDKPFNFPKSIMNPSTLNSDPVNMPHNKMNQPPTTMYQNASSWSKYNNPVVYHNQIPPDIDNTSISSFGQKTDVDSRLPYDGNMPNSNYNSLQTASNMNYRRPLLEGSYNKSSSDASTLYNKPPEDQSYNRHFNTSSSSNFHGYNQTKGNGSDFSNFSRQPDNPNTPYQQSNPCLNTASSKPPSLLSLNLIKPITLDKPGNYLETQNDAPDRYERNWNIADEEDDPENEYMEAHKKFSSEPFDNQNDEDEQFSNKQHRNMYNENHYSRELSGARHINDDYLRPLSQSRESQIMRNTDNKYVRPNSQFSRNINQGYSQEMLTLKNNKDDFFKYQKNIRNMDKRFSMGTPLLNDNDEEFSNEPIIDKNNFVSQKSNYELNKSGQPSRENYESSRDRPPSIGNYESSRDRPPSVGNNESSRGGRPPSRENYVSSGGDLSSRGNYDSFRGRLSSRGNYDSFRGGPPSRENHNSSREGPLSRGNYNSFRDGPPSRGNFGNNTSKASMEWEWDDNYTKNEEPIEDPIVSIPTTKQLYEEAQPIDPVKIFDYRHLPRLKVIPGLSKETVVPVRIYDYKHGGKRILPWQDRGYSRRNSNHTRDSIEQEDSVQDSTDNDDLNKNKETLIMKPTVSLNDIPSDKIEPNNDKKKTAEIIKETPITIDTITIVDDEDEIKKKPEPEIIEIIDICAPSPPRVSKINEVEKSSNRQLLTIETLLCPPGRPNRPSKIVIILRGLPGSGKSHVAKLIKEKEVAMGGQAPRILSLDDYFMTEVTKMEIDPETNKKVERKVMEYEHDSANESLYRTSFIKAFKKKILENYFSFYVIDAINNKVSYYKEIIEISRMNGFTVYIIELECDIDLCIKRNIHNRTAHDINSIMRSWVKTPSDQILLDIRSLLLSPSESEMEMEDVSDIEMEVDKDEEAIDNRSSEENRNVEFEEEKKIIVKYLGPEKFKACRWVNKIILTDFQTSPAQ